MRFWHRKDKDESYLEKRERIRLSEGILDELKKQETLRKDVLTSIGKRSSDHSFFRHPATLLVFGFLLTGGLGTVFSIYWNGQEWDRQQNLLATQRSLDQKYQVANDTAKAIGELQASMMSVLRAVYEDNARRRLAELRKAVPVWKKTRIDWQVKSYVIASQLSINFPTRTGDDPNQTVASEFRRIFTCYHGLNNALANMAEVVDAKAGRRNKEIDEDLPKLTAVLNSDVNGMTTDLMSQIGAHIRPAPKPEPVPSSSPNLASSPSPPGPVTNSTPSSIQAGRCSFTVRKY